MFKENSAKLNILHVKPTNETRTSTSGPITNLLFIISSDTKGTEHKAVITET